MWELIAENKKKSAYILVIMFLILIILGAAIGISFYYPNGIYYGILIAFVLWVILSITSYYFGDNIVLSVSKAVEVTPEFYPRLYNIVEEMKIAANAPYMPRIYISDDDSLNAFATGIRPQKSAIVVTAGLLETLNRDELQGVIAHEMSHILNNDVFFMTFAGVLLGTVTMISSLFIKGSFYSRASRHRFKTTRNVPVAVFIISLIIAVLAPFLTKLFYFSLSRRREYLADACAVRLTRYPEGLASALEKIAASSIPVFYASKITAPMYISNPFTADLLSDSNYSTHPPVHVRIKILRSLMGNVSYNNYQKTFSNVSGKKDCFIPASQLINDSTIKTRAASSEEIKDKPKRKKVKEISDLLMAANGFFFLPCECGLNLKIPPSLGSSNITCPRCATKHTIPSITSNINQFKNDKKSASKTASNAASLKTYKRKGSSWETFYCSCGNRLQLSPLFKARFITCRQCKNKIEIIP